MEELKIEMIEDKSSKFLVDLNMEKRNEIEEIEIKQEKLKIAKKISTVRKLITLEKYWYHVLRHRRYCAQQKT